MSESWISENFKSTVKKDDGFLSKSGWQIKSREADDFPFLHRLEDYQIFHQVLF